MTAPAPSPPQKALQRVLAISRLNGWSVTLVAVFGVLLTLLLGDLLGTLIGLLAVTAGWMEIRGHGKLRRQDAEGMKWLVRSQLLLLSVILAYCASRLGSFDADSVMGNLTPDMETILQDAGVGLGDILPLVRLAFFVLYGTVAFVTVLYQGGLALYYRSKTKLVTEALTAPPHSPLA